MRTIMLKRRIVRVKIKNHVIQLCNTNNFVENNGGDANEDYHVKKKDYLYNKKWIQHVCVD